MNLAIVRPYCPADPAFEKLFSENRDRYIAQSKQTKCGQVAELPPTAQVLPIRSARSRK